SPLIWAVEGNRSTRRLGARPVVSAIAVLMVVVASAAAATDGLDAAIEPSPQTDRSVGPLSTAIREVLPKGGYGIGWFHVRRLSASSIGTAVDLPRHGYDIDFPADQGTRVRELRSTGTADVPPSIIVGQTPAELCTPPDGADLIVRRDRLSSGERARADRI